MLTPIPKCKYHWLKRLDSEAQMCHTNTNTQTHTHTESRAPSEAQFGHLWPTRTDFNPPVCAVDPLNLLVRGVFTLLSFVLCVSLKSVSSSLLWKKVCVHAVEGKPVSTSKPAVILSKLINRGWRYPPKKSRKGWRYPPEREKIGSPSHTHTRTHTRLHYHTFTCIWF